MEDLMLTTKDNPYNPFTQYDEWDAWDKQSGYHTTAYLARVSVVDDSMSESDVDKAINEAMNEILLFDVTNNYIKVNESYFNQ